ncbi:hypothetical protein [Mesorhizobium sp.]|uniref:hypothetical protein n=1 Tax=Mesorhizobium sp. TaxID=1871066 RepID=UPI000FE8C18F|nr:hypothetical protein [Mesorhizobium sp.]RWB53629.1 MAG: hypothetical protein EOQ47_20490 [Mesorhizobium sp.]
MFWNIVLAIASYALQLLLAPKPQNAKAKTLSDFQAPTAEEGREIPVVFGTVDIASPNVTWYGDLKKDAIKGPRRYGLFGPRQVLGYKYSLGMQQGLCHGPADAIKSMRAGGKIAWTGSSAGGRITINKPNLFGGDKSEGGIKGDVDICMGAPDQLQNDYLVSQLGDTISAYRGVLTAVLRQVYLGTSNYIKPWEWRIQRILKRSDGSEQWYPEKAIIKGESESEESAFYIACDMTMGFIGTFEVMLALTDAINHVLRDDTTHKHDIRIVAYRGTILSSITERKCKTEGFDRLQAWVDNLHTYETTAPGEGDFNVAVSQAASFFDGAGTKRRKVLVLSGDACVAGSPEAAKATLDAIDNCAVHGYLLGFGTHSPNMNVFDNTPEDDQIDGDCPVFLGNDSINNFFTSSPVKNNDMNPAHIIRECLTDATWGMGYHDSDIGSSFVGCADTFFNEGFGLSLAWYEEQEIEAFVSDVQRHADCYLYGSRSTGKFELKAIRNDYDIDLIPLLTEDDIIEFTEIKRRMPSEATSSVLVKFYDRQRRKTGARRITNTAQAMQSTGNVPPKTNEYPAINRKELAIRVGQRDVVALSSGLVSGRIITKRRDDLNPGFPFRIAAARYELFGEVMRVANLRFGDGRDNKMGITLFQDVFKFGSSSIVDDGTDEGGWEPPSTEPQPVSPRLVHEMPYREARQMVGAADLAAMLAGDSDAGLIQIAGSSPTPDATNALIEVDAGSGYEGTGDTLDFAPGAFLDGDVAIDATAILVSGAIDLDNASPGILAAIVGATPQTTEIVRVDAIVGSTLNVARGCLDTVPQAHADGAAIVFFDDISNSDFEIRTAGNSVAVKLLTATGTNTLDLAEAPADTVTFDSRAIRPLRPANVQVNGIGYGLIISDGSGDLAGTWAERNRLTELAPLGWTDATVSPEAGQTTIIEVLDADEVLLTTHSGLSGTSYGVPVASFAGHSSGFLRFGSERDGYREWQPYQLRVVFTYLETGVYTLTGQSVGLVFSINMPVTTGVYTLTGNDVGAAVTMAVDTGAYALTGNAANLQYSAGIQAATGVYTLTGNAVVLTFDPGEKNAMLPGVMADVIGNRQSSLPDISLNS